ncbi:MAG TPA: hypothetical protein VK083_00145 [Nocardia sp.]|uniref:hypothetical protein n=1 Tax=Nocardia TaxID=1817 RepID=UPI0024588C03|nr:MULTISPECIES: hypothetical protein [Nocardia]HLS75187.1 hypothetical protein [Nocardia sp.]
MSDNDVDPRSENTSSATPDSAAAKVSTAKAGDAPATAAPESASATGDSDETVRIAAASGAAEETGRISGSGKSGSGKSGSGGSGSDDPSESKDRKGESASGKVASGKVSGAGARAGFGGLVAGVGGALALAAALGAAGYFYVQNDRNQTLLNAHEEARQAACDYAPRLADYDANNLDAYFSGVLEGATGQWYEQFDDTSRELREVLTEGQVVSTVQSVECAIKTGDQTSAEAVVMIGQTISSVGTQGQPSPGQLAMVLRMEKTEGRWLVNQVDSPLPAPQQ